jgi:hypothetical protein
MYTYIWFGVNYNTKNCIFHRRYILPKSNKHCMRQTLKQKASKVNTEESTTRNLIYRYNTIKQTYEGNDLELIKLVKCAWKS